MRRLRSFAKLTRWQPERSRRAWRLIDELNGMAATPLVETRVGGPTRGGATLTAAGRRLFDAYGRLEATTAGARATLLQEIAGLTTS